MYPVILASASPRRSELLQQIGITFRVQASKKEEVANTTIPWELVMQLSKEKAGEVAESQTESCLVIGADTVVAVQGEILGKPADVSEAKEMLCKLSGRTHQVYTGVTVLAWDGHQITNGITFYEKTDVTIAELTIDEIQAYIDSTEPMDKAGAYGIQGRFACYVERIDGDYYTVVGLPIAHLYRVMKKFS